MPCLSASAVVIRYEEALYQMYAPLPFMHLRRENVAFIQPDVAANSPGLIPVDYAICGPACASLPRQEVRHR